MRPGRTYDAFFISNLLLTDNFIPDHLSFPGLMYISTHTILLVLSDDYETFY